MSRKIIRFFAFCKRLLSPRLSLLKHIEALERRNKRLSEENLNLAGYVDFLTGKCIQFHLRRLITEAEKGSVVA